MCRTRRKATLSLGLLLLALLGPCRASHAASASLGQAQVNGVAVSTGLGLSDTGTQRVSVSSDTTINVLGSFNANGSTVNVQNTPGGSISVVQGPGNWGTIPLVVDSAGNIDFVGYRVGDSSVPVNLLSGVFGPNADGVPSTKPPVQIGGIDPAGNVQAALMDTSGKLEVSVDSVTAYNGITSAVNVTSAAITASNIVLISSNTTFSRQMLSIFNDTNQVLVLRLGGPANANYFTLEIPADGLYEMTNPVFQGEVDGFWQSSNGGGGARITEWTK